MTKQFMAFNCPFCGESINGRFCDKLVRRGLETEGNIGYYAHHYCFKSEYKKVFVYFENGHLYLYNRFMCKYKEVRKIREKVQFT